MLQLVQSPFVATFDVSAAGEKLREFFLSSRELAGLTVYKQQISEKHWSAGDDFASAEINYLLGKAAEHYLPNEVLSALENLSLGGYPRAILLKGMPTGEAGDKNPEKGFPFCAMSLRAIAALLVKRKDEWEKAAYATKFNFESNSATSLQGMHCDYPEDRDDLHFYTDKGPNTTQIYSLLHYTETDRQTPTWMAPYHEFDAGKAPDPSRHIPVIACPGDLLAFNNLRVIHARGAGSGKRHFVGLNPQKDWEPMRLASSLVHATEMPCKVAAYG